jgi:DNA-directed RNA polymerase specialized sigma24 family protein
MSLSIDKKEMDQAWHDRRKSNKFYEYLYEIAKHQVARKGNISHKDIPDYVQFAVFKCFKHENSFTPNKGAAYSFFWKQISLAIAYRQRKEARRNSKARTFYVDQEKVLDWMEMQQEDEGESLFKNVDLEEAELLKKTFKKYNSAHKDNKVKPSKESTIKVLEWQLEKDPNFLENFPSLKHIFASWLKEKASTK